MEDRAGPKSGRAKRHCLLHSAHLRRCSLRGGGCSAQSVGGGGSMKPLECRSLAAGLATPVLDSHRCTRVRHWYALRR